MQTMNKWIMTVALLGGANAMANDLNNDHPLSWIESTRDRARVMRYAEVGSPTPVESEHCPSVFPLSLGEDGDADPICVRQHTLPADVAAEIETMASERFLNFSDYDRRTTKLYVFERPADPGMAINPEDVRRIATLLNIPKSYVRGLQFSNPNPSSSEYLSALRSVYRGDEFVEDSAAFAYVSRLLSGQQIISVSFGPDEIGLYPGGGFGIGFYLYLSERYLIYAKVEGWNS